VIGLSRENPAIKYAALVLAIVLVGSVLAVGLTAAKTTSGVTTHTVKNPNPVAKAPSPASKTIVLKANMHTKTAVKPKVKPTIKPR